MEEEQKSPVHESKEVKEENEIKEIEDVKTIDETDHKMPSHDLDQERNDTEITEQQATDQKNIKPEQSTEKSPAILEKSVADPKQFTAEPHGESSIQNEDEQNKKYTEKADGGESPVNDTKVEQECNDALKNQKNDKTDPKKADAKLEEQVEEVENEESKQISPAVNDVDEQKIKSENVEEELTSNNMHETDQMAENEGEEETQLQEEDEDGDEGTFRNGQSVDLDLINRKRQEEKEVFQKLIDDVTRLEHEKENSNKELENTKLKLDVCLIELDSEKEKCQEQNEIIRELESHRAKIERKHKELLEEQMRITPTETADNTQTVETIQSIAASGASSHHHKTAEQEAEINDLHLRVKMMVEADEQKNVTIERLETQLRGYKNLLTKVEHEIGSEKLTDLKDNQNGIATSNKSRQPVRTNEVAPPQESKVCMIL